MVIKGTRVVNMGIEAIMKRIFMSIQYFIQMEQFSNWLQGGNPQDGDLVILNNSFIFRDKSFVKTSKNSQYLSFTVSHGKADLTKIFVTKPGEINSNFKLYSTKSSNFPLPEPLQDALSRESRQLGRLVFVLIGELQEISTSTM